MQKRENQSSGSPWARPALPRGTAAPLPAAAPAGKPRTPLPAPRLLQAPPVGRGQPGAGGFLWVWGAGAQKFDGQRLKILKVSRKLALGGGTCPRSRRLKQPDAGASSLSAASFSQVGMSKTRGSGGFLGGAVGSVSFQRLPGRYDTRCVTGRRRAVAPSTAGGRVLRSYGSRSEAEPGCSGARRVAAGVTQRPALPSSSNNPCLLRVASLGACVSRWSHPSLHARRARGVPGCLSCGAVGNYTLSPPHARLRRAVTLLPR